MNMDMKELAVGALAGAATIVLCLGIATGSGLALILFFLSPLPVMVAALGWSVMAGATGVIVGAIGITAIANIETAGFVTLTTTLPAAMAGWWLSLSRPASEIGGPNNQIAWYPLSDVIFRMAMMTAFAFIVAGIITGYGPEFATQVSDEMIRRLQENNPEFGFTPEAEAGFVEFLTRIIPLAQPAMWLLVLVMNLYFALALARTSGRVARPPDVWPISLRMPTIAMIVFAGAMALTFFSGGIALAATAIVGALLAGFTLSGFAVFHAYSVGKPWRTLAMIVVYGSVVLMVFPAIAFTVIGMFNLARNMPVSTQSGGPPPPPTQ